jgi:16S rRNA (uracil1498-N3)-methyltransferase
MASTLRICLDAPLPAGSGELDLPAPAVRHLQVRRLQPGDALRLFDGRGDERDAVLLAVGRQSARVAIAAAGCAPAAELPVAVTLALGVPANDRMDRLVEKATELGVASIQPLLTERSVLRLQGERARARCEHWRSIAMAASEQCGRAVVPTVEPWMALAEWLARPAPASSTRWVLSTAPPTTPLARCPRPAAELAVLSGPEGGLAPDEMAAARAAGFLAIGLGPRVLRADTAPLAVMAWLSLQD